MRVILIISIALLARGTSWAEERSIAKVCFVRHEDGGRMNLLPVRVYGSHGDGEEKLVELSGGSKACMDLEVGAWLFEARSSQPHAKRAGSPNACRSNHLSVEVAANSMRTIVIAPKFKGSKYICGWDLR